MIVISSSVTLDSDESGITANNPRIGYHTLITASNLFSDEADSDFPLVNLANPATYLRWKGTTTGSQAVGIQLQSSSQVDYFGIAAHNLGSTGATIKLQSSSDGQSWDDVTDERMPGDDTALIEEFADVTTASWFRIHITPGSAAPEIGVLYIGRILRLPRRLYVGHTPLPLGRQRDVSTGRSESGQFLGRVVRSTSYESSIDLQNVDPDYYRDRVDDFVKASADTAFFWAWRSQDFPNEVGFCWCDGEPEVSNQRGNGMMSFSMNIKGIR